MKQLIISFMLLLFMLPINSQTVFYIDNLKYTVVNADSGFVSVRYADIDTLAKVQQKHELVIPGVVTFDGKEYRVKDIEMNGFANCDCQNIIISEGLESISDKAFVDCKGLTNIVFPSTLRSIDNDSFKGCISLKELKLSDGITFVGSDAFKGCTALESVYISPSVTGFSWNPFADCPALKRIEVDKRNKVFDSRNDCNAIIDTESNCLFVGCANTVIPESVESINTFSFYGCTGLSSVHISKNVIDIKDGAFAGCPCLNAITVDAQNPRYDSRNDCNCIIDRNTNSIVSGCVSSVIPSDVSEINDYAFMGMTLPRTLIIPENIKKIHFFSFALCNNITELYIPHYVNLRHQSFSSCHSLRKVYLGKEFTTKPIWAFDNCTNLNENAIILSK